MNYVLIAFAVSIGWHVGKLLHKFVEEVVFNRLHASDWYAVLCKKMDAPAKVPKNMPKNINIENGMIRTGTEAYKGTSFGFRVN